MPTRLPGSPSHQHKFLHLSSFLPVYLSHLSVCHSSLPVRDHFVCDVCLDVGERVELLVLVPGSSWGSLTAAALSGGRRWSVCGGTVRGRDAGATVPLVARAWVFPGLVVGRDEAWTSAMSPGWSVIMSGCSVSIRRSPVSRRSRSGCTRRVSEASVARPGLLRPASRRDWCGHRRARRRPDRGGGCRGVRGDGGGVRPAGLGVPAGRGDRSGAGRQRTLAGPLPASAGRGWAEVTRRLREAFAGSAPLLAGAAEAGDPLATLPALFHMMWRQELVADVIRERLGPATPVRTARTREGGDHR